MKALIVGGTGPTGPCIVDGLLSRGYAVTILHRGTHEIEFSGPVEHLHGDPHFVETLEKTLGSRTFDLAISNYGRLRLVAEVMKGRTPRFIGITGSGHFLVLTDPRGPVGIPIPLPEDSPVCLDPSLNKFQYLVAISEQEIMKIHDEGHYNATILRYPVIYGPRQLVPAAWCIIKRILDGRKQLILPDGGFSLQTEGYAENMAHAVLLAVDKPEESRGQIYFVRDDKMITLRERIEIISQVMHHEWEFINMPGELALPSYPYSGVQRWRYHRVTDISKIKSELGYRDLFPVEEAIGRTVNWYLQNPPEPAGQEVQNLRDPFDYEVEDRFITEFREFSDRIMSTAFAKPGQGGHPYPHPKEPGQLRDEMGR